MNYRTDMKAIIADIEREYSMLSYSFLKQTYLSFRTKQGQSTELIWWQIFQSCYDEIIKATEIIINSPKRRLKSAVRHERAERLPFISPELENGMRRLEVKDISDLYEIWCFIKVKNIVSEILGESAKAQSSGKELTSGFIRQLVYGQQSEVTFFNRDNVELASVMYNAEVEKEDEAEIESAIKGTDTLTTIQRPDIVLRLSKNDDTIQYTYLFDAKYRIADKSINGLDVPPVDAINQMHRYRDAIYYTENSNEQLKREVIGGYVLYPENLTKDDFDRSYYKRSIDRIGIGAFPLKPAPLLVDEEGNAYLDPTSSENELRQQIEQWLKDDNARQTLLQQAIPQRGLKYQIEDGRCDVVLVNYANEQHRTPFIEKKLCYLRTGDANGSVRLPALGKEPKFLLLHNGSSLFELFELEQNGAKIYSKQQLIAKGFSPSEDGFYLCYSIKTNSPIATNLPQFKELMQKGKLRYTPQLIMVENILDY